MNAGIPSSTALLELLKKLRKQAKLTQAELAESLGITQEVMSRYESGKSPIPLETAIRLIEQLGSGCQIMVGEPNREFGKIDPGDPYRDYLARLQLLAEFIQNEEAELSKSTERDASHSTESSSEESLLEGCFLIINASTGKCVDVKGESVRDGGEIVQYPRHGGDNQQWHFLRGTDGYFEIISKHSGKSLDDAHESRNNGGCVHQWSRHGNQNQQWILRPTGDGGYFIESRVGGLRLDAAHDGETIHLWSIHGEDNQKWRLERVSKPASSSSTVDLHSPANLGILVRSLRQLPRLVIAGRSDAGKSHVANSLLGMDVLPTDYQPLTKIPIAIVHTAHRPSFVKTDCAMMHGAFDVEILTDESKFAEHLVAGGERKMLFSKAVHTSVDQHDLASQDLSDSNQVEMDWAIVFLDADILRACVIVDTPGFSASDTDTDRAAEACQGAEILLYCSPAVNCLNQDDFVRLNRLIKALPSPETLDGSFPSFGNFMFVITHAGPQISEEKLQQIKQKVSHRFGEHFHEEIRQRNGLVPQIEECFVTFWSELESRYRVMREKIHRLLCSDFPRYRMALADLQISDFRQKAIDANQKKIDEWKSFLTRWQESKTRIQELEDNEPERREWVANRRKMIEDSIRQHELDSVSNFSGCYDEMIHPDYIEGIISGSFPSPNGFGNPALVYVPFPFDLAAMLGRGVSRRENINNEIVPLILKEIHDHVGHDLNNRSNQISDQINAFLKDYSTACRVNIDWGVKGGFMPGFDAVASFACGLAGVATLGALAIWAASLGNLGGYIIVAKVVGFLAAIGIPTGGVAAVVAAVSALGGPFVFAIAISLIAATAAFCFFSKSWERRLAEKICKEFNKHGVKEAVKGQIQKYWSDTLDGFRVAADVLDRDWAAYLSDMRRIVESDAKENVENRIDLLDRLQGFFVHLPWIRMTLPPQG